MLEMLMKLANIIDDENKDLLKRFVAKAISTGNANAFIKVNLKKILEEKVQVEVIESD